MEPTEQEKELILEEVTQGLHIQMEYGYTISDMLRDMDNLTPKQIKWAAEHVDYKAYIIDNKVSDFVCGNCGSDDLEAFAMCKVNTAEFVNWSECVGEDDEKVYCNQCGEWGRYVERKDYEHTKIAL